MISVCKDGVVIEDRAGGTGGATGTPVKLSLPADGRTFKLVIERDGEQLVVMLSFDELEAIGRCYSSLHYALTPECRKKLRD